MQTIQTKTFIQLNMNNGYIRIMKDGSQIQLVGEDTCEYINTSIEDLDEIREALESVIIGYVRKKLKQKKYENRRN